MKLEFLQSHQPRWLEFLAGVPHQFYHLPGHSELWARQEAGLAEATLITEGDDYFFLPSVLKNLAGWDGLRGDSSSYSDLRSPYGYPGPLIRAQSPSFLSRALRTWMDALRERRVVSGFVRLDPLESASPREFTEFGKLCFRGETVSVDLTNSETAIWQQIRRTFRRDIQVARRLGLVVKNQFGEQRWDEFVDIYYETMNRVGADGGYYYPHEHFDALSTLFEDKLCVCSAENSAGQSVAAGVFIEYGGVVQHHLQANRAAGLRMCAAKLVVHAMMLIAKARGNRLLHLGGGLGGVTDSLFQFKSRFSRSRHPFATWHLAFLPVEYKQLVARRRMSPLLASETNFFPMYRARELCS